MSTGAEGQEAIRVVRVDEGVMTEQADQVAIEEPLEIRVEGTDPVITMRTPGHDRELAAGLLFSEGLAREPDDFQVLSPRLDRAGILQVVLRHSGSQAAGRMQRSSLSNSACGVCGKKKLNLDLMQPVACNDAFPMVSAGMISSLPDQLRRHQGLFDQTGGLHAAALFDRRGELMAVREDIGRHNALDKLNGWALLNGRLPLSQSMVMLSGRASFELLQKCIMAGVPLVCAVSAPSSYAVRLAREFGVTLVGFVRESRFNVYSHPQRIELTSGRELTATLRGGRINAYPR